MYKEGRNALAGNSSFNVLSMFTAIMVKCCKDGEVLHRTRKQHDPSNKFLTS